MVFYGYHGAIPAEQQLGQRWEVDVDLWLDLKEAGRVDELSATVDYSRVYSLIKEVVEERHFRLAEALAEAIAGAILESQQGRAGLEKVTVRVRKLQPPLAGMVGYAEVEITRP
ncbi:MAG: dihydroneopterin aldolase [Limnochordales bacterium]|nr:dihydroneopterin aldolase [Limnochordales bacterium]